MRKCLRCGTEMLEGWNVKEDGHKHEIFIDNGGSFVRGDGRMGILKAAVCPQCGEVSVYVDDPDTVINGWRSERCLAELTPRSWTRTSFP